MNKPTSRYADLKLFFEAKFKTKIGLSTIGDIIRERDKYLDSSKLRPSNAKRIRESKYPLLEEALSIWFNEKVRLSLPITDEFLLLQAKEFGPGFGVDMTFKYSVGWLDKFKKRYHISCRYTHGEANSVDPKQLEEAIQLLAEVCKKYDVSDIYNFATRCRHH